MAELRPSPRWKLLAGGALVGWLVGVVWSVGLALPWRAIGGLGGAVLPPAAAPLLAVSWAYVGMIVGAAAWAVRGPWVPAAAALGACRGAFSALATFPSHAWATGTLYGLGWALACTAAGAAYGLAYRLLLAPAARARITSSPTAS